MQNQNQSYLVLNSVLFHVLPQHLDLFSLFFVGGVHFMELYVDKFFFMEIRFEFFHRLGTQTNQAPNYQFLVFFGLVQANNTIVNLRVELVDNLLMQNLQLYIGVILLIVLDSLHHFHQAAVQIIEHEPEVGKILLLTVLLVKGSSEVVIQKFIPIRISMSAQNIICYLYDFRGDYTFLYLVLGGAVLLELRRYVLFLAQVRFAVNFQKLLAVGDFLIFIEQRVLKLPEFLLEHELAGHKNLAGNDDIQKIKLAMKYFRVLVDIGIEYTYFLFDFVHKAVILAFLCLFVACQILIEFLEEWKQRNSQFMQFFIHFSCDVAIISLQIDHTFNFGWFGLPDLSRLAFISILILGAVVFDLECRLTEFPRLHDDVVDDLVFFMQLPTRRVQDMRWCLLIMVLLYLVGEIGNFDEGGYFLGAPVDHIVGQLDVFYGGLCHPRWSRPYIGVVYIYLLSQMQIN